MNRRDVLIEILIIIWYYIAVKRGRMYGRLVIKDLHVSVENKEILKGLSLTVKSGERHA